MKEKAQLPGFDQHKGEFLRLRRQIKAMVRQKLEPPQEMLERMAGINNFLKQNYPGNWVDYLSDERNKRK